MWISPLTKHKSPACHFRSSFFACVYSSWESLGCSQLGCLSLLTASILACHRLLRHCPLLNLNTRCCLQPCSALSFAHYPPLPALQPVASLAGHPPGALNPLGVDSSACSQLDREIVLCVTLCVPAGLCWSSLNPAGFHGQG